MGIPTSDVLLQGLAHSIRAELQGFRRDANLAALATNGKLAALITLLTTLTEETISQRAILENIQSAVLRMDENLAEVVELITVLPPNPVPPPGDADFVTFSERHVPQGDQIMDLHMCRVTIPASSSGDVVTREATVKFVGENDVAGELSFTGTGSGAYTSPDFEAQEGSTVNLVSVDTDNATPVGNKSPEKSQDFVVGDTTPPDSPGDATLETISERTV